MITVAPACAEGCYGKVDEERLIEHDDCLVIEVGSIGKLESPRWCESACGAFLRLRRVQPGVGDHTG